MYISTNVHNQLIDNSVKSQPSCKTLEFQPHWNKAGPPWEIVLQSLLIFRENSAERELPAVKEPEVRLRYFGSFSLFLPFDADHNRIIFSLYVTLRYLTRLAGERTVKWENRASFLTFANLHEKQQSPRYKWKNPQRRWSFERLARDPPVRKLNRSFRAFS